MTKYSWTTRARTYFALLLAAGCSTESVSMGGGPQGGPSVVLLDSVILQEHDSLSIGPLRQGFGVDSDGGFYLGSTAHDAVLRYRRNGALDQVFRLPERGAFSSVGPIVYANDSFVAVSDAMAAKLMLFGRPSGELVSSVAYRGYLGSFDVFGDSVIFGNLRAGEAGVVGVGALSGLLRGDTDASFFLGTSIAYPEEYQSYPELDMGSDVRLTTANGKILVGFAALNDLVSWDRALGVVDTLIIPSRLRRGVPQEALKSYFRKQGFRFERALESISILDGVWARPNGQVVLVHMDASAVMSGRRLTAVSAKPYVSLLSAQLDAACIDHPMAVPAHARPGVHVRGDTLYLIDQRWEEGPPTSKALTVLRRFLIDDSECEWVPLGMRS